MYNFIIVSIGSNNRSFLRIHFSKIWTHGCIQTGSWRISAFGKTDGSGIVMSCRHLLEVYRLWRVSFQLDMWNCTRVQTDSWYSSKLRTSDDDRQNASRSRARGQGRYQQGKRWRSHIPTPNLREAWGKPGSYASGQESQNQISWLAMPWVQMLFHWQFLY